MEIGTTIPTGCTGEHQVPPDAVRRWAERAERAEFAGLWVLDHLVKPQLYATSFLHPLNTLSHVAAVTDSIPLGTSILLLPVRGAPTTADAVLTLQYLADRDISLGVGAGLVPDEFEVTGVPIEERGPRLSEGIEVLQELFSGNGTFEGKFHSFEDITIDPVFESPPRILAGGSSIYTDDGMPTPMLERIVTCEGWIAPPMEPTNAHEDWETISDYAEKTGVNPDTLDRIALAYVHIVDSDDRDTALEDQREAFTSFYSPERGFSYAREGCLTGTIEDIQDRLQGYKDAGFDQVIAGPVVNDPAALDEQMDLLIDHVLGAW